MAVCMVVVMVFHEAAHLVVARAYRYPVVCFGASPLAFFGIVVLDRPVRAYWWLQVLLPMAVTAEVAYAVFFGFAPSGLATLKVLPLDFGWHAAFSVLLAILGGTGDVLSMASELRRGIPHRERVARDVRFLARSRCLIRFTDFGHAWVAKEFGMPSHEFVRVVAGK